MNATTNNHDTAAVLRPRVDIYETAEHAVVRADMPGVPADQLDVTLEHNVLTIHGKGEGVLYQRAFTLSRRIDREAIDAQLANGVLTLTLPFAAELLPTKRQIAVTAA